MLASAAASSAKMPAPMPASMAAPRKLASSMRGTSITRPVMLALVCSQNGFFVPRPMLPLALSYDHRVIDGADAARFVRFLVDAIEQPYTLLLEEMEQS